MLLHAGTGEHRDEQTVRDGLGEQALNLLLGEGLALEVLLHELVVGSATSSQSVSCAASAAARNSSGISVSVCLVPSQ